MTSVQKSKTKIPFVFVTEMQETESERGGQWKLDPYGLAQDQQMVNQSASYSPHKSFIWPATYVHLVHEHYSLPVFNRKGDMTLKASAGKGDITLMEI